MITLTREEAQQVLDALYSCDHAHEQDGGAQWYDQKLVDLAYELLRARLAEKEQEPVAWGVPNTRPTEKDQFMMLLHSTDGCQYPDQLVPLYTAPPQRKWQGLPESAFAGMTLQQVSAMKYAESVLKEKNR